MSKSFGPITVAPASPPPEARQTREERPPGAVQPVVDEHAVLGAIYRQGDRWMGYFMVAHLLIAAALAPFHDTWIAALGIGGGAALLFFGSARLWPGRLVTRMVAGVSLQAFCALHIFQMAGLAEMHFFFFTSVTALVIYQDWRAPWPGVFAIILQHTVFHHLHNQGIHPGGLSFFEPEYVSGVRMSFHYGIALAHVAIAVFWARALRRQTVQGAAQRAALERANSLLAEQQAELETTNEHLQEQQAELEKANGELRESEQRFRSTFDQAAVGVAHVDLDGRWLRVNDRMCAIVGYAREELLGLTFQDITHPDDLAGDLEQLRRFRVGETSTDSVEKRYLRKGGAPIWVNRTISLVRDPDGTPRYFIAVVEDVDARKRVEAERDTLHSREREARSEAEAANRAKMEFLSAMSHELRTPLNAVTGYVDLLEMGLHGPVTEAQLQALGRIKHSGEYLLALINDILQYAKIEAGRIEYQIEELPLAELVSETGTMVEPQIAASGLQYTCDAGHPSLTLRADRERVRQILLNVLSNAAKFTPPGGRIDVACREADGRVHLVVSDTGPGIPAEMVPRIFEPFVQVRNTSDRDPSRQGVGLGLAISRDLARGMGGDLTVESTLGEGSTFTLSLPGSGFRSTGPEPQGGVDRRASEPGSAIPA